MPAFPGQPFWPQGPLTLIGTSAVQLQAPATLGQQFANTGLTPVRVRNVSSSAQYFAWGGPNVAAPTAPTAGSPSPNTIGMLATSVETFSLPPNAYYIASAVGAFEMCVGDGE